MALHPTDGDRGRGVQAAVTAYVLWGLLTIYWKQLTAFDAFELIGWRVASASLVMAAFVTRRQRWPMIQAALADRRLLAHIAIAAVLLTGNWTSYVYAIVDGRIIETSLGYFMAPLGTMVLGIVVLEERPSPAQLVALALAGAAVIELTVTYGQPPILALVMAVSWSLYGLFKRQIPLPAVEGFAAESFVLFVPSVLLVAALAGATDGIVRTGDAGELALVSFAGVVTAAPLVLFAFAAARVPLTVLGVLQYLVPIVNFAIGWLVYGEQLPWTRLVGFALVWLALVIVSIDGLHATVSRRAARVAAVSAD